MQSVQASFCKLFILCVILFFTLVAQFDVKNQRIFLRRTRYDGLQLDDLFVGNRVNVFTRQLCLVDYGDHYTANKLGSKKERCDSKVSVGRTRHDPAPLTAESRYYANNSLHTLQHNIAQNSTPHCDLCTVAKPLSLLSLIVNLSHVAIVYRADRQLNENTSLSHSF